MGGSETGTTRKSSFERQRREEDADADSGGWAGTPGSAPAGRGRGRDWGQRRVPGGGFLPPPTPRAGPTGSHSLRPGAGAGRGAEYQVTAEETRLWQRSKPSRAGRCSRAYSVECSVGLSADAQPGDGTGAKDRSRGADGPCASVRAFTGIRTVVPRLSAPPGLRPLPLLGDAPWRDGAGGSAARLPARLPAPLPPARLVCAGLR